MVIKLPELPYSKDALSPCISAKTLEFHYGKHLTQILPIVHGLLPLLTMDVWEHVYYLDYRNKRPDYVKAFIKHLINWDFVNSNIGHK